MFNEDLRLKVAGLEDDSCYVHGELIDIKATLCKLLLDLGYEYKAQEVIPEKVIPARYHFLCLVLIAQI